ncbi:MAG: transcription elongation factor GreA [Acidimicrobiia bacterium]|nr:transcription elongation factor GreA [Acidimicrobiia bacterium]
MASTHLSRDAYDRLQAELDDLTTRGRVEIAAAIERARELGDLSENGDYHAAKDDQGRMEARIRQLQAMLKDAEIVDSKVESGGIVAAGSVVTIKYEGDEDTERYLVGSIEERHHDELSVISPGSPLGQSLMGRRAGDVVQYEAPGGTLKVEVIAVDA